MKLELFSVSGWPEDSDADQQETAEIGTISCDVVPNVGDCVEWETEDENGRLGFWTAVVIRRFFHISTGADGRVYGVTVRLSVEMTDHEGDPFPPDDEPDQPVMGGMGQ